MCSSDLEAFPGGDIKADAFNGMHDAVRCIEVYGEVFYGEDRHGLYCLTSVFVAASLAGRACVGFKAI